MSHLDKTQEWHDIVLFALHTGLRKSEIFNLKFSHIDFTAHFLKIVDTKTRRNRVVPLNQICRNLLIEKIITSPDHFVFNKKSPKTFTMAIKLCGFNDNVTDRRHKVVFHSLRHTFASWLVQQDIHLSVISRLLGHSDIQLTMRYAHLS
ncbi:MAG: site-specific integrase, partial [Desulfocapsaceae bacterium]|nr:site-specific integrase [Desulfocapsaceae bacterium]